jgi:hypothetical protein
MGSSSYSKSTNVATDNRLAVTDQAFGLSSSGTGNNVTANGNIFNLTTGGVGKGGTGTGSTSAGGSLSLSILDGGAVDRSLDFAENSLSMVLAGVLDAQKLQAQAVTQQADTVAGALAQAAQVQADSQASTLEWIQGNAKILAGGGLLLLAAWYFFIRKGRK